MSTNPEKPHASTESEARLQIFFQATFEAVLIHEQGVIIDANQAAEVLFGYPARQLIGMSVLTLAAEVSHDTIRQSLKLSLEDPFEVVSLRQDGTTFISEISVKNIVYAERTARVVGIRDITRCKQAESQLQQQAERARLLGAITARIRQTLDLDKILTTAVTEARSFLQVDRVVLYEITENQKGKFVVESTILKDTIVGLSLHDPCFSQDYALLYQQGRIRAIEDLEQAELSPCHLEALAPLKLRAMLLVPIVFQDQLWGLLCAHHCTSPRRWQAVEIELLQQLTTQVAIAIQQAQLFRQLQQQAQREQLLNQITRSLNSSLDPKRVLQEIVCQTGECFAVERVLIFAQIGKQVQVLNQWPNDDDGLLPLYSDPLCSVLSVPIFIHEQHFGGLTLQSSKTSRTFTVEEVSLLERIAAQAAIALFNAQSYERLEQLVQKRTQALEQEKRLSEAANQAKSQFLATMSHELRTPLNAVLGLSQVLQQEFFGPLNPKQKEYITCIHGSGEHLLSLINDILDLAKIESGKEELVLSPISVAQLCTYCLRLVQEQATRKGLQLTSQIDPTIEGCFADERRLKQILLNLLSNAVKFTVEGQVSLSVQKSPQGITFTVADTGIGIAAANLPSLFQPFFQLDSQANRQYEGTGLGLSLARNLAQLHGGDITVQSTFGQGSQFILYLPDDCSKVPALYCSEQAPLLKPLG